MDDANEAMQSKINELTAALEQEKNISAGYQVENESLKKELEILLKSDHSVFKDKVTGVGSIFEIDGRKYKMLLGKVNIPGVGIRTALEFLTDPEAQKKLVAIGSGAIIEVS